MKERDRFLISYYLVLRYGDSVAIQRSNVIKHGPQYFYHNVAEKTGTISIIPMKRRHQLTRGWCLDIGDDAAGPLEKRDYFAALFVGGGDLVGAVE